MEKQLRKATFKGILVAFTGLTLTLAFFSFVLRWNLVTLILFWFVIVPLIAVYLPAKISKNRNHLSESLTGLIIFYALMIFLIYDHYQSDYFLVMMMSCGVNLVVVTAISLTRNGKTQRRVEARG